METAFYLYGFTDEVPDACTMATKREAAPIADSRVKQVFMPGELLGFWEITEEFFHSLMLKKYGIMQSLYRRVIR